MINGRKQTYLDQWGGLAPSPFDRREACLNMVDVGPIKQAGLLGPGKSFGPGYETIK